MNGDGEEVGPLEWVAYQTVDWIVGLYASRRLFELEAGDELKSKKRSLISLPLYQLD